MDTADRQGASGSRYRRPYAVPERLDLLYAYLDEKVLRRLWALPWLPAQLRRA
jgi:hypothetical protein